MSPVEVLKLVVSNLKNLKVPYMVGGSFASSAYGVPRTTLDADVVIDLKPEQVAELVETFRGDFYVDPGQVKEALRTRRSFNVIHLEAFFKADLFILGARKFDCEQFSRRRLEPLESGAEPQMYVASAEDVVLSKLEWYRLGGGVSEQQWRDIIGVLKIQAGQLDLNYLRKWAAELRVSDLLASAFQEAGYPPA